MGGVTVAGSHACISCGILIPPGERGYVFAPIRSKALTPDGAIVEMNGEPQLLCDTCGDTVSDELPHMTGRQMLTIQFDHTLMSRLFPLVAVNEFPPADPIYAEANFKLVTEIVDKLLQNMAATGVEDRGGYRHMCLSYVPDTKMPHREFRIRVRYGDGGTVMFQYGEMVGSLIVADEKNGDKE